MYLKLVFASLGVLAAFLASILIRSLLRVKRNYPHLVWVGAEDQSLFSLFKARFTNLKDFELLYAGVIKNYTSENKACLIPSVFEDWILLPKSELEWFINQPDHALDAKADHHEMLQPHYTVAGPHVCTHLSHHVTISRDLTRRLQDLVPDIYDELDTAVSEVWGTDTSEWKQVNPFQTLMQVVGQTSARIFVGRPLCRSKEYLEISRDYAMTVIVSGLLLRTLPPILRPVLAPIITRKNKTTRAKLRSILEPAVIARQKETAALSQSDKSSLCNDFLQWTINSSLTSHLPLDCDPTVIAERLAAVTFAAIHTTTITITSVLFDLISPPCTTSTIHELREEITSSLARHNNQWTRSAIQEMHKLDSCLREALRLDFISPISLVRKVTQPGGLVTPFSKTYLPKDSFVGMPSFAIHHDPSIYPDPDTYKPFRFSEQRHKKPEDAELVDEKTDSKLSLRSANLAMYSTSYDFQSFGLGKHACPGRFFASNEVKLLLAYILVNYDIERRDERPRREWKAHFMTPPENEVIRVRRREKTEVETS